uniref:Uncharacterized protein n=1 Tax=Octopus bimaculoides TaxID=37653 RepID=A0A0L8HC04_OCTBM
MVTVYPSFSPRSTRKWICDNVLEKGLLRLQKMLNIHEIQRLSNVSFCRIPIF